ncbi:hypothetical protein ES707_13359 [subsurface metagenome]
MSSQTAGRLLGAGMNPSPQRGNDTDHDGKVVKGVGQQDRLKGIQDLEGRLFQPEQGHQETVEHPVVPEEADKAEHHDDRGQHKGNRGQGLNQALTPKFVAGQQIRSGQAQEH